MYIHIEMRLDSYLYLLFFHHPRLLSPIGLFVMVLEDEELVLFPLFLTISVGILLTMAQNERMENSLTQYRPSMPYRQWLFDLEEVDDISSVALMR